MTLQRESHGLAFVEGDMEDAAAHTVNQARTEAEGRSGMSPTLGLSVQASSTLTSTLWCCPARPSAPPSRDESAAQWGCLLLTPQLTSPSSPR